VEPERYNRCTANRRQADDQRAIRRSDEMLCPELDTRVEQRHRFAWLRIDGIDAVTLEVVAAGAGEPEVLAHRRAAVCFWITLLVLQRHPDRRFWRVAVAAACARVSTNLAAQFDGNIGRGHGCALSSLRVGRWPRHFSSTAAYALRSVCRSASWLRR